MIDDLEEFFEKHDDEFLKFERITDKISSRPDLHAFTLLNRLCQGDEDMVCAAEHDEIFLAVTPDEVCAVATEEQLIDLHRCGVRCDKNGLCMYA